MKKTIINIPEDIRYLSEYLSDLPENSILMKGMVGCGGSTIAINSKDSYVICVPFNSLIQNKLHQHKHIFGLTPKTTKKDLDAYLKTTSSPKIMVTYNSLYRLNELINTKEYRILIDEYHLLFTQYSFRRNAVKVVLDNYLNYKSFCFMTATLLEEEFILDELLHLPVVEIQWSNVKQVAINTIHCKTDVFSTVMSVANQFLNKEIEGNAYFFVNSIKFMEQIVRELGSKQVRCIFSRNGEEKTWLKNSTTTDTPKKINLLTSTVFEGCDIYDENGRTFIVSDSKYCNTLVDIVTSVQQIAGRIRNSKYSDAIYHLYSQTRYKDLTFDEFKQMSDKTIEDTYDMLQQFSALTGLARITVLSGQSMWNDSYLNADGDNFIFDPNKVKIDMYNYKIINGIYSVRVNIVHEYQKHNLQVNTGVDNSLRIIPTEALKTNFKDSIIFYEELLSTKFSGASDYREKLIKQYPWLDNILTNIGIEGIKQHKYNVTNLKRMSIALLDTSVQVKVFRMLNLDVGSFVSASALKNKFKLIYETLHLTKIAKASDVENYYQCKITARKINGETINGYTIIRSNIVFKS